MALRSSMLRFLGVFLIAFAVVGSPAHAQNDGPIIYRVQKGDTLYGIAKKYLTSHAALREVQKLNRIANPRRIPINKRLRIPRKLLKSRPVVLTVNAFSGPVKVAGSAPQKNQRLREDQVITTGPNAFIRFESASKASFTMPSNSTMRLAKARRYILGNILDVDFVVQKGRGGAKSPSLKDQERLRLRTPKSTTAVRGTDFRVAYLEESEISITEVVEGSVNLAVGEEARVTDEGFGVASTPDGIGEPEALLEPVQFVDGTKTQTNELLTFSLVPLDKAKAYRVQLASDISFSDIIEEVVTSEDTVSFPVVKDNNNIEDGRYAVRARGISASGVEGNSESFGFRRKRLGVAGSSEQSDVLDGWQFKWSAVGEGPSTFAFQLWSKGNRDQLLIDETGISQTSFVLTDLAAGSYEWRVAVIQAGGEDSFLKVWSEPEGFSVSE